MDCAEADPAAEGGAASGALSSGGGGAGGGIGGDALGAAAAGAAWLGAGVLAALRGGGWGCEVTGAGVCPCPIVASRAARRASSWPTSTAFPIPARRTRVSSVRKRG